jgi:hypothetical protein
MPNSLIPTSLQGLLDELGKATEQDAQRAISANSGDEPLQKLLRQGRDNVWDGLELIEGALEALAAAALKPKETDLDKVQIQQWHQEAYTGLLLLWSGLRTTSCQGNSSIADLRWRDKTEAASRKRVVSAHEGKAKKDFDHLQQALTALKEAEGEKPPTQEAKFKHAGEIMEKKGLKAPSRGTWYEWKKQGKLR